MTLILVMGLMMVNYEYSVRITREDIVECVKEYIIKMVPEKILNNDFPYDVLVIHIRSGIYLLISISVNIIFIL
jgi:hypothetical protein